MLSFEAGETARSSLSERDLPSKPAWQVFVSTDASAGHR
jgi:hypothetical protein